MRKEVVILGSSGMLGRQLTFYFKRFSDLALIEVSRSSTPRWDAFPGRVATTMDRLGLHDGAVIINASGWIPQKSVANEEVNAKSAELMNHLVPLELDAYCAEREIPYLQIGTDCVFSGKPGLSFEDTLKDASDLYGISKIRGEGALSWATVVRCSIVGKHGTSGLYNWLVNLEPKSEIKGFVNHLWNGVSTLAFAKLAEAWLRAPSEFSPIHHWIPADYVSKFKLLEIFCQEIPRHDISVLESAEGPSRDMRLGTRYPEQNAHLWSLAGYGKIPTVSDLCREFIREGRKRD